MPELQNSCNAHDIILLAETWLSCKDTLYLKGLIRLGGKEPIGEVVAWQSPSVIVSDTAHEETFSTATN
jgi:hypothetical protein